MRIGRRELGHLGLAALALAIALQSTGAKGAGGVYLFRYALLPLGLLLLRLDFGTRSTRPTTSQHVYRALTLTAGLIFALYRLTPAADFYFARLQASQTAPAERAIVVRKDLTRQTALLYSPRTNRYEWFRPVRADFVRLTEKQSITAFLTAEQILPHDLDVDAPWLFPAWLIAYIGLWFGYSPLGLKHILSGWTAKLRPKLNILGPRRRRRNPTP